MSKIIWGTAAAIAYALNIFAGLAFAAMLLSPASAQADPDINCGIEDCGGWSHSWYGPPGWAYGGYYGPGWYYGHYWGGGPWYGHW